MFAVESATESSAVRHGVGVRSRRTGADDMALTNTAPVADDATFIVQQGLVSASLSGNFGVGDADGSDHDPDGDALGWTVAPVSLDRAFFSEGQLKLVSVAVTYGVGATIV